VKNSQSWASAAVGELSTRRQLRLLFSNQQLPMLASLAVDQSSRDRFNPLLFHSRGDLLEPENLPNSSISEWIDAKLVPETDLSEKL
jgi:hypothetical protein